MEKECKYCQVKFNVPDTKKGLKRLFCSSTCAKKNNGESNKGRKMSDEFKENRRIKYTGSGNPFFGKQHSDATKEKLSLQNKGKMSGSDSPHWKGGIRHGREYLRVTDGRYLHRIIMENSIGRKLFPHEHVHHIDENTLNNEISNIEIKTNSEHRKLHVATQKRINGKFSK